MYVEEHVIFLFFLQEIQFLNHVCSSTQQYSYFTWTIEFTQQRYRIYSWCKQHEWGKGGYYIAKPYKTIYFVIFLTNQVSSIEHHLTTRVIRYKKLKILKTEDLHWKQKELDWKIHTTLISYFWSNGWAVSK
jgi:hypothetical protein